VAPRRDLPAAQAKALLAKVRRRDVVGKSRRRVAAELISDLERVYSRKKAANKELIALLAETGTTLESLPGIGSSGAARLLVEIGDITRFPDRNHFASWNGTPPIDASSGDQVATGYHGPATGRSTGPCTSWPPSSSTTPGDGRAYYDRRKAEGKTFMEAMRALKRRLSDIGFRRLLDDHHAHGDGPGRATGQRGNGL